MMYIPEPVCECLHSSDEAVNTHGNAVSDATFEVLKNAVPVFFECFHETLERLEVGLPHAVSPMFKQFFRLLNRQVVGHDVTE